MKWLGRLIKIIISLFFVILIASIIYFLTSQSGLRQLVQWVSNNSSNQIKIENITGKLMGPMDIKKIIINKDSNKIILKNIHLNWRPIDLLRLNFNVSKFSFGEILSDKIRIKNYSGKFDYQINTKKINLVSQLNDNLHGIINFTAYLANKIPKLNNININLVQHNSKIYIKGAVAKSWDLNWSVHIPNLNHFLPDGAGSIDSNGEISGLLNKPNITADGKVNKFRYLTNQINNITFNAKINLANNINSIINLTANDMTLGDSYYTTLSSTITGNINKQHLILDLSGPELKTNFNLTSQLSNIYENNRSGKIIINEFKLASNGYKFYEAKPGIINYKNNSLDGKLWVGAKQGVLNINFKTSPLDENLTGYLTAVGKDILISDNSEYKITVSPDLKINYKKHNIYLSGKITVPKADITPEDFSQTVTLPSDVEFVTPDEKKSKKIKLDGDIKLVLGHAVNIAYAGLSGSLGGELHIYFSEKHPTNAIGTLKINNGQFKAHGMGLKISRGRVDFTGGPIANPGLDVRAQKTLQVAPVQTQSASLFGAQTVVPTTSSTALQTITVGVNITGRVKSYKVSLFSNPATLSQADILSYLVTGQSATQLTNSGSGGSSQSGQLLQVASALNLGGGKFGTLTSQLQKTFGLSQIGFASGAVVDPKTNQILQNTSVVLGKKLSKRLTLNYSIGLIQPINTFNINYQLSKHFSLLGTSNNFATGLDALYSFSKK